jgi:hypothetical protein
LAMPVAVEQTSGRQRLNIHGAIDLETGRTRMIEAATVNAISMISANHVPNGVMESSLRPTAWVWISLCAARNLANNPPHL